MNQITQFEYCKMICFLRPLQRAISSFLGELEISVCRAIVIDSRRHFFYFKFLSYVSSRISV